MDVLIVIGEILVGALIVLGIGWATARRTPYPAEDKDGK